MGGRGDSRAVDEIVASRNPWRESFPDPTYDTPVVEDLFDIPFDIHESNAGLDFDAKSIGRKVAPSVVSVISSTGQRRERQRFCSSGTIVEQVKNNDGRFTCTVLTSAGFLNLSKVSLDKLEIHVYLRGGQSFDGHIYCYDAHYNIALIKIETNMELEVAILRKIDISAESRRKQLIPLLPRSDAFKLIPGDNVWALGRFPGDNFFIMVAPGKFSMASCKLDCVELLSASCKITPCGIGGPIVNCNGDVVGITSSAQFGTPFLPTNIICKWLDIYMTQGKYCRPFAGIRVINLYAAGLRTLDWVVQKFGVILHGVFVQQVIPGSPAVIAGIRQGDIIVECCGFRVPNLLKLFEIFMDNAGEEIEIVVVRAVVDSPQMLKLRVAEFPGDRFNQWPLRSV